MGTSAQENDSTVWPASRTCPLPRKRSRELCLDATADEGQAKISGVMTRAMHKRLSCMRVDEPVDPFNRLCDDLILSILGSLASRAQAPSHLIAAALTCKRFYTLAMQKRVLTHAGKQAVAVRPSAWGKEAENFLRRCADSGSLEASFTLGMIKFYCMGERRDGVEFLAMAAKAWHADALYALAIIQINGSGGKASDKNDSASVALCVRAALKGSVEAMRELGHCLKEGQGLPMDAVAGRQLLLEANKREACLFLKTPRKRERDRSVEKVNVLCTDRSHSALIARYKEFLQRTVVSDYGCTFPRRWILEHVHPAHSFMVEWFATHAPLGRGFLRLCSHAHCGRAETRPLEFRQCSVCSSVFYCSRSCQSTDWKLRHMVVCQPSTPSLLQDF